MTKPHLRIEPSFTSKQEIREAGFLQLSPVPANMQLMTALGAKISMTMTVAVTFLFTLVLCEAFIRAKSGSTGGERPLALGTHRDLLAIPSIHFLPLAGERIISDVL